MREREREHNSLMLEMKQREDLTGMLNILFGHTKLLGGADGNIRVNTTTIIFNILKKKKKMV